MSSQGNAERCGTKICINLAQYRSNSDEHRRHSHLRRSKKRRLPAKQKASTAGLRSQGLTCRITCRPFFSRCNGFEVVRKYVCSSLSERKPYAFGEEPELALPIRESDVQASGPRMGTTAGTCTLFDL